MELRYCSRKTRWTSYSNCARATRAARTQAGRPNEINNSPSHVPLPLSRPSKLKHLLQPPPALFTVPSSPRKHHPRSKSLHEPCLSLLRLIRPRPRRLLLDDNDDMNLLVRPLRLLPQESQAENPRIGILLCLLPLRLEVAGRLGEVLRFDPERSGDLGASEGEQGLVAAAGREGDETYLLGVVKAL